MTLISLYNVNLLLLSKHSLSVIMFAFQYVLVTFQVEIIWCDWKESRLHMAIKTMNDHQQTLCAFSFRCYDDNEVVGVQLLLHVLCHAIVTSISHGNWTLMDFVGILRISNFAAMYRISNTFHQHIFESNHCHFS